MAEPGSSAQTLLSSLGNEGMKARKENKKAQVIERGNSVWEELFS